MSPALVPVVPFVLVRPEEVERARALFPLARVLVRGDALIGHRVFLVLRTFEPTPGDEWELHVLGVRLMKGASVVRIDLEAVRAIGA